MAGGMMAIMNRSGGIAVTRGSDSENKIRDIVMHVSGSEIGMEQAGRSLTFEIDVRSE